MVRQWIVQYTVLVLIIEEIVSIISYAVMNYRAKVYNATNFSNVNCDRRLTPNHAPVGAELQCIDRNQWLTWTLTLSEKYFKQNYISCNNSICAVGTYWLKWDNWNYLYNKYWLYICLQVIILFRDFLRTDESLSRPQRNECRVDVTYRTDVKQWTAIAGTV